MSSESESRDARRRSFIRAAGVLLALLAVSCEQANRDLQICTVQQKNLPVIAF